MHRTADSEANVSPRRRGCRHPMSRDSRLTVFADMSFLLKSEEQPHSIQVASVLVGSVLASLYLERKYLRRTMSIVNPAAASLM